MTLEEQIALFVQKIATKNNLPDGFSRTIKDVISKTISIEEWNTFTQYITNNTSDIKSVEEFVLVLADYIEGYVTKEYVDNTFETKEEAFSGNYNDLTNKPTIPVIPTNISAFYNDSGYLTSVTWSQVSSKPTFATVATSGSYNDLTGKPTIPTDTSDLTNNAGFITIADVPAVPTQISAFNNDVGYITSSDVITYHAGTNITFSAHTGGGGFDINAIIPTLKRYFVQFDVYSGSEHYVISAPFVTTDTLTTGATTFANIKQYLQEYMFAVEDNILNSTCGCLNTITNSGCVFYYNNNGTSDSIAISSSNAVTIGQ